MSIPKNWLMVGMTQSGPFLAYALHAIFDDAIVFRTHGRLGGAVATAGLKAGIGGGDPAIGLGSAVLRTLEVALEFRAARLGPGVFPALTLPPLHFGQRGMQFARPLQLGRRIAARWPRAGFADDPRLLGFGDRRATIVGRRAARQAPCSRQGEQG